MHSCATDSFVDGVLYNDEMGGCIAELDAEVPRLPVCHVPTAIECRTFHEGLTLHFSLELSSRQVFRLEINA